jgi:histone H3/H4
MDVDADDDGNDVVMKDVNEECVVKKERTALTRLPIAKVKNIFKLDWDNKLGQKNSYVVIAKMTELFLNELAKNVHAVCKRAKRKTMNIEDIAAVVKGNEGKYGFVDIGSLFYVDVFHNKKSKSANTRGVGGGSSNNNNVNTNNNNTRTTTTKLPKQQHQHNNVNNNNRTIESMFQMKQQQ